MFKVQRFTAEDDEEEGGRSVDDSANILNKVLERARARTSAKRARLASSSDNVQYQAATSALPLDVKSEDKVALSSAAEGLQVTGVTGGQGLTAAGSSEDGAGDAAQEQGGGASEDDEESSDEEESSSGESDSEGDESGESSGGEEVEKDAEILQPPAPPEPATAGGSGDGEDEEADGKGLRPMEGVAEEWGLDSRLVETLREEGVKHFFPIQVNNSIIHTWLCTLRNCVPPFFDAAFVREKGETPDYRIS